MHLTSRHKKQFRAIGHQLDPVVTIGPKRLSEQVLAELDRALNDHELIKIKVALDRDERKTILAELVEKLDATEVQSIGNRALIYRPAKEPNPKLSNLLRSGVFVDAR